MNRIGVAYAEIQLKKDRFLSDVRAAESGFRQGAQGITSSAKTATDSLVRMAAAVVGIAAAVSQLRKSVEVVREFDRAWRQLWVRLGNVPESTMRKLADWIESTSNRWGHLGSEGVKAFQSIVENGNDAASAMKIFESSAKLAVVAGLKVTSAARALGDVLSVFKLGADQAEEVAAKLVAARLPVDELATGLARLGPVARALGLSFDETLATLTVMSRNMKDTQTASAGLTTTMTTLAAGSGELGKLIKKLGFDSGRAMIQQLGLGRSLALIAAAAQRTGTNLEQLGFSSRTFAAASEAANAANGDLVRTLHELAAAGANYDQLVSRVSQGFDFQLNRVTAQWNALLRSLGEIVLPIILSVLNRIVPALASVKRFLVSNADAIKFFAMHVVKLVGLVAGVALLAKAFSLLSSPIMWLVAAAAALYFAWDVNLWGIREALQGLWDTLGKILEPIGAFVLGLLGIRDATPGVERIVGLFTTLVGIQLAGWAFTAARAILGLADVAGPLLTKLGNLAALGTIVWTVQPVLGKILDPDKTLTTEDIAESLSKLLGGIAGIMVTRGFAGYAPGAVVGYLLYAQIASLVRIVWDLVSGKGEILPGEPISRDLLAQLIAKLLGAIVGGAIGSFFGPTGTIVGITIGAGVGGYVFTAAVKAVLKIVFDLVGNPGEADLGEFQPVIDEMRAKLEAALEEIRASAGDVFSAITTPDLAVAERAFADLTKALKAKAREQGATTQDLWNLWTTYLEDLAAQIPALRAILEQYIPAAGEVGERAGKKFVESLGTAINSASITVTGLRIDASRAVASAAASVSAQVQAAQAGGPVPGSGTGDSVPALLEPGEFVVPRWMMRIPWLRRLLEAIWASGKRMQAGGPVSATEVPDWLSPFATWLRANARDLEAAERWITNIAALGRGFQSLGAQMDQLTLSAEDLRAEMESGWPELLGDFEGLVEPEVESTAISIADPLAAARELAKLQARIGSLNIEEIGALAGKYNQLVGAVRDAIAWFDQTGVPSDGLRKVLGEILALFDPLEAFRERIRELAKTEPGEAARQLRAGLDSERAAWFAAALEEAESAAVDFVTVAQEVTASLVDRMRLGQEIERTLQEEVEALKYFGLETTEAEQALLKFRAGLLGTTPEALRWKDWLADVGEWGAVLSSVLDEIPEHVTLFGRTFTVLTAEAKAQIREFLAQFDAQTVGQLVDQVATDLLGRYAGPIKDIGLGLATGNVAQVVLGVYNALKQLAANITAMAEEAVEALATQLEEAWNALGQALTVASDWLSGAFEAASRAAEWFGRNLRTLGTTVVGTLDRLGRSVADLVRQTEQASRIQQSVATIQRGILGLFTGFLWPIAAILMDIAGLFEEAEDEYRASLNVPVGWKVERAEYRAATPGEPPVAREGGLPPWLQAIVDAFRDAIEAVLRPIREFIRAIEELWKALAPSVIKAFLAVVQTFVDVLQPVAEWMRDVLFPDLRAFFEGFASWWRAEVDPFLKSQVFPVLGQWITAVYELLRDRIVPFLRDEAWGFLKEAWPLVAAIIERIGGVFGALWEVVDQALIPGLRLALAVLDTFSSNLTGIAGWIRNTFAADLRAIFDALVVWWRSEVDPFLKSGVFPQLGRWLEALWRWLADSFIPYLMQNVFGAIRANWPAVVKVMESIGLVLQALWSVVQQALIPALNFGISVLSTFSALMASLATWVRDTFAVDLRNMFGQLTAWWRSEVDPFLKSQVFPALKAALESVWNAVKNNLEPILRALADLLRNLWPHVERVLQQLSPLFQRLVDVIIARMPDIERILAKIINDIPRWIESWIDSLDRNLRKMGFWAGVLDDLLRAGRFVAQALLVIGGALIGFFLGGPVGAAIGAAIGAAAAAALPGGSGAGSSAQAGGGGGTGAQAGGGGGTGAQAGGGGGATRPAGVEVWTREQLWAAGYARGSGVRAAYLPGVGTVFTSSEELFLRQATRIMSDAAARALWASMPAAARGGIVPRPTVLLAGERGAEAILPLERLDEFGFGGEITINNVVTLDGEVVYRSVQRHAAKANLSRTGYNLAGVPG